MCAGRARRAAAALTLLGAGCERVRVVRAVWRELSTRSRRLPACRGAIPSLSQQPLSALVIIGANHASPLSLARTQLTLDSLLSNSRSIGGTAGEQQEQRRLVSNERCSHESERREWCRHHGSKLKVVPSYVGVLYSRDKYIF